MIPTVEEYLNTHRDIQSDYDYETTKMMIEFAKLHVEAALQAAEKSDFIQADGISISPKSNNLYWSAYGNIGKIVYNKQVILNAYPLTLIK